MILPKQTLQLALAATIAISSGSPVVLRLQQSLAAEHVPPKRLDFDGYGPNHFETTFWELRPQRLAPKNCYTGVGVPGWPVTGFGSAMRARYSEFDLRFTLRQDDGTEVQPSSQSGFRQYSPGDWLPGVISEWEAHGVRYRITFITIPNEPKPLDLYRLEISNVSDVAAKSQLIVTLDGAPTLEAQEGVVADQGKPLIILDPPAPAERIKRAAGVVDPRTTGSCSWGPGSPVIDKWKTHRTGWYGMPVEYLLSCDPDRPLQVFVGLSNDPVIHDVNWDIPDKQKDPEILKLYDDPGQEVTVRVEGAEESPPTKSGPGQPRRVLRFLGRDEDADGYIRVAVRATPQSPSPAVVAMLWAFDDSVDVSAQKLSEGLEAKPIERAVNEIYDQSKQQEAASKAVAQARHVIDVGSDLQWGVGIDLGVLGKDPTVFAQRLSYEVELQPKETKSYLLRLPTIDRPETGPYGWLYRPYDTGQSWMRPLAARHPENSADYSRDVPPGADAAEYAAHGPEQRHVWQQQQQAARSVTWDDAMNRLAAYWNQFVAPRAKFISPEPYLDLVYKHCIANLNLYRNQLAPTAYEVQLAGPDWYWDTLSARDVPYMLIAWDWAGFPEVARSLWDSVIAPSSELPESRWNLGQWEGGPEHDGMWLTRDAQWSGQGQTLWGIQNHYQLTNDREWLKSNYSKLRRGADWIVLAIERERQRLKDPNSLGYGTMPPAGPEDGGPGHNYYVNAFTVLGLNMAASSAEVLGESRDAERWRGEAQKLKARLDEVMRRGFFRFNDFAGTLPAYPEWYPGPEYLSENNGQRVSKVQPDTAFGTALIWPTEAVAPFNPMMQGWYRNRELQGVKTAGLYGWPYIQVGGAIGYIRRGEPDRACDWFYAFVNHASGTLEWGEGASASEDSPDISTGGQMPHNWATGMYIAFLRHLFLMEEGEHTLHLAPATPRHWLAQDQPIGVENAPSAFGNVTYQLQASLGDGMIHGRVQLDPQRKPHRLVIHVRGQGGGGIASVSLNGSPCNTYVGDAIVLADPPNAFSLDVKYAAP